jgi:hypothetical protein
MKASERGEGRGMSRIGRERAKQRLTKRTVRTKPLRFLCFARAETNSPRGITEATKDLIFVPSVAILNDQESGLIERAKKSCNRQTSSPS